MEKTFPGVKIYISCRTDCMYLFEEEERVINREELNENKNKFAYIRELLCDMQSNPVEEFMKESEIPYGAIIENEKFSKTSCVILTNGNLPVKSLTENQLNQAILHAKKNGCNPEINKSIDKIDWIIGVENEDLYKAASQGKKVTLIPTGFGENLFNRMFPRSEILAIKA